MSGSARMCGAGSYLQPRLDFRRLYARGKLNVFPRLFQTKADVLKETTDEMPFDPAHTPPEELRLAKMLDEKKLKKTEDRLKGEKAEFYVIEQVRSLLKDFQSPSDPPCFILHNVPRKVQSQTDAAQTGVPQTGVPPTGLPPTGLPPTGVAQTGVLQTGVSLTGDRRSEIDTLILSRKMGVVVIEVKATESPKAFSRLKKAGDQLRERREQILEGLGDWITSSGVTAVMTLPNLENVNVADIRGRVKSLQGEPRIEIFLGRDLSGLREWMESMTSSERPEVWGSSDPDQAFQNAAIHYLSAVRVSPGDDTLQRVGDSHHAWLLTPDQMELRDLPARLLHVWGPPGAGKTLLLLHTARRWLGEGLCVVVATGSEWYDVLRAHMARAILRDQPAQAATRLRVCGEHEDTATATTELKALYPSSKVCVVLDELSSAKVLDDVISALESETLHGCWSADVRDIGNMDDDSMTSELEARARKLGWESRQLPECIRCPQHVVELLNRLLPEQGAEKEKEYIRACSVPRDLAFEGVTMVDHACHVLCSESEARARPDLQRELRCPHCRQELETALQTGEEGQRWQDWVCLATGEVGYLELRGLATWLREELHVPAVCEMSGANRSTDVGVSTLLQPRPPGSEVTQGHAPTSSSSARPEEEADARRRERVVAGRDCQGGAALHVMLAEDFLGLEKHGVLLIHWDFRDANPDCQRHEDTEWRRQLHREEWFQAASRCQGQLVMVLLSPSPARSLLDLPGSPVCRGPGHVTASSAAVSTDSTATQTTASTDSAAAKTAVSTNAAATKTAASIDSTPTQTAVSTDAAATQTAASTDSTATKTAAASTFPAIATTTSSAASTDTTTTATTTTTTATTTSTITTTTTSTAITTTTTSTSTTTTSFATTAASTATSIATTDASTVSSIATTATSTVSSIATTAASTAATSGK